MYTLVGSIKSRAFRVLWALEEMGIPYAHQPLSPRDPAVVAHNPSGKVPVLITDEGALTDSTAILTYLADRHGQLTAPAGSYARGRQDGQMQLALDDFDALLWVAARHSFVLPPEQRMPAIKDSLRWEFARNTQRVADQFSGLYLAGPDFSIADIVFAHCLNWAGNAGFAIEHEVLLDYQSRMKARAGFQAVLAKSAAA